MSTSAKSLSAPQKAMRKLGLERDIDLALHLPLRWEDETRLVPLAEAARQLHGEPVQFEATVVHQDVTFRPRRQLLVTVQDGDETCLLRFFNFYPSQQKQMAVGTRLRVRGELRGGFGGLTVLHPAVRAAGTPLAQSLTPVYPTSAGLPQAYLRKAVLAGLARADLSETLPAGALQALPGLQDWPLQAALQLLHQPPPGISLHALQEHQHPAWQRLKAEELLTQQLSQHQARSQRQQLQAPALHSSHDGLPEGLLDVLPFALTSAQQRVSEEIARDLSNTQPMHRLLQGDVGSGKTVVAALAACVAIEAGWQCALMAPTEILAEQHFAKLVEWLAPLLQPRGQCVAWLTGSLKKKERDTMLDHIANGSAALVVGTHAVIQQQVQFARLGLAVIDEQHRFGVQQRLDLRHATQTHEELVAALPEARVGLLHARLAPADKKQVMADFVAGHIDLLVATTVIEVGVDVPNASLMVIEHAERFGLSQLHQLRGRVGRGSAASACVLLYQVPEGGRLGQTARARLRAMVETNDGFEIARRDLAIRGPGEFLGARQSGAALLRFADLAEDGELLHWARETAPRMLAHHPELAQRHMDRWLGARADYLKA